MRRSAAACPGDYKLTNQHKKKLPLFLAACFFSCLLALSGCSKRLPVEGLHQYNLDNGLTVFAQENHAVPLVYICIAVRAGAVTQTPENAGLFHLYEHMMFKGNELYPTAAEVQRAIKDMGITDWNGTTGVNCVNYFFTVPKDQLENGLAFWNAAIRSPLMDSVELENEKKVVLSEIEGSFANPSSINYNYLCRKLFPAEPYRTDPGGASEVVRNATVAQLHDIQSRYYIPSNAALFVGGDIDPAEVQRLAKKIFGTWSNNGNPVPENGRRQSTEPFSDVQFAVMPNDQVAPQIASVSMIFRGPDTDFDIEDTYAADYLLNLLGDPDGTYRRTLQENPAYQIPSSEYIWSGYQTTRADGMFSFGAVMLSPEQGLCARVSQMLSEIQDSILPAMAADESLYSKQKVADISRKLRDSDIMGAQTASGLLSTLQFWWVCSSPEYYYTYNERIAGVTQKDVQGFVEKYFAGKKPLVAVVVHPSVYEQLKQEFDAAGYDEVTAAKAFWWKDASFAPDPQKIAAAVSVPEKSEIYVPGKALAAEKKYDLQDAARVDTYKLSNGIPVHVQHVKGSKIDSVSIVVRGGIEHLTPETSGLEAALFRQMAGSSENYDNAARKTLSFDTQASISQYTVAAGSALSLGTVDAYLYKMLPVLVDGFLHPAYEQQTVDAMMTDYTNSVQSMLNDPNSLLSYSLTSALYKNHPFATQTSVTPDSIDNITVENMQALHKKVLDPANMFVVVVGGMDGKKLVKELDKSIGQLPAANESVQYGLRNIPPVQVGSEPVVLTHPSAERTGYIARVFASPPVTDPDFIPAVLASDMYSTVMFNVVREQHGACYTPRSRVNASAAPAGMEFLYRLSDPEHFASYMEEARNYMLQGKLIDAIGKDGNYIFADIEDRLPSYKNAYIISTYGSQATVGGVATNLVYNILTFDDMHYDLVLDSQVEGVSAAQIEAIFRKYWVDAPSQWWAMVGPDLKDRLQFNAE